jgi:pyrroloquinoline quinone biosynthesis protein B
VRVRLLGTAAGGGFPQWNCACPNCDGVRRGTVSAVPRRECCVAVSADGHHWFLINAPPDVRVQVESFRPLGPAGAVRGSGIAGVLLTGADLDQVLGLLALREGPRLAIHATAAVRHSLEVGLSLPSALDCFAGADWQVPPETLAPLLVRDGSRSGLAYAALPLPGRPPRYAADRTAAMPGDSIAYLIVDGTTGGRLVVAPAISALSGTTLAWFGDCDALLVDGAFWDDLELPRLGIGKLRATDMGHVAVGGPDGTLAELAPLPVPRKIYVHVNNTNPMLLDDSPERRAVERGGMTVGQDGCEFEM